MHPNCVRLTNTFLLAMIGFATYGGSAVEDARKEFNAAIQDAQRQYNQTAQKAATKFKGILRQATEDETKAGRLDGALTLRSELTSLDSDGLPLFAEHDQAVAALSAVVPGTWSIVYVPNHTKKKYFVKANGELAAADGSWKGRLQKLDGALILSFEDGKMERWTFAGTRLFVEHFVQKSLYPDNPEQIGLGVKGEGK